MCRTSCVMSKQLNLTLFTINCWWFEIILILILNVKYLSHQFSLFLLFFSIHLTLKSMFDTKWFHANLNNMSISISTLSINNVKSINKIVNDKTIFNNNLTSTIFNFLIFRTIIDRHQITIYINIKILFIKNIKNFNINFQTNRFKKHLSFLFCQLTNNFCNLFSKTRQIRNSKINHNVDKQTTQNQIIKKKMSTIAMTKLKSSLSKKTKTMKRSLRKIFTMKKNIKIIILKMTIWIIIIRIKKMKFSSISQRQWQ